MNEEKWYKQPIVWFAITLFLLIMSLGYIASENTDWTDPEFDGGSKREMHGL